MSSYDEKPPATQIEMSTAPFSAETQKVKKQRKCCPNFDCTAAKWTIFRFIGLCLIAILILCCVYGLRDNSTQREDRSLDEVYAVGDRIFARDLWLVIEYPSDSRGRRTRLGKQIAQHVCNAIKAGQAIGWTPLVVGGRSLCCRTSRCRHLHPIDLVKMNHSLALHFWHDRNDIRSALRSAGYLAAIKKGATFVFQANPEVYFRAGVDAKVYQAELEHQLRKMTLGISVGLVKENPEEKYHFDPYAHFSPDHEVRKRPRAAQEENQLGDIIHKYKVCEIRPPSLEKFLDQDGFSVDEAAPALTLPGQISAPFDSRNTLFGRDALWSLLVIPIKDHTDKEDGAKKNNRDSFVIRSILSQAILAEIGGSTKFSVAKTPTSVHVKELIEFGPRVSDLLDYINGWSCGVGSALICLDSLVKELVEHQILEPEVATIVDLWINDLIHVGYHDVPTVRRYPGYSSPCIGQDALHGVYFHPALTYRQTPRGAKSFDHPKALSTTQLNRQVTAKAIQRLCPAVDMDTVLKSNCQKCDKHEKLLLIVTFNNKQYDSIPLFEVIYRHHFQNILYCGEPDEVVDRYMEQYNGLQGTYFSFLPAKSKTGYECLLGAIEMGYNVQGYLVVTHDTLVNSWNFADLDMDTIWHGNEHVKNISAENIMTIDPPNGENIMKSTRGILEAFEFLEDVLLKGPSVEEMTEHMQHDEEQRKKRFRRDTEDSTDSSESSESSDYESDDDMSDEEFEAKEDEMEHMDDPHIKSIMDNEENNKTDELLLDNNFHISLFGEIIPDDDDDSDLDAHPLLTKSGEMSHDDNVTAIDIKSYRNVSELLFHPANFKTAEEVSTDSEDDDAMSHDHFSDMMFNINRIYSSIAEKLSFWQTLTNTGRRRFHQEEESLLNKDLEQFQCDVSTNSEICQLVSGFFQVLQSNEGPDFHLFHDNLPIYYVPASYKEKLYLMANLFIRYHVSDEMAFPLLLRGLQHREEWTDLRRSQVIPQDSITKPQIDNPEDLLLLGNVLTERDETLRELESGHYIHPVDTGKVLKNDNMRDVICRNF